MYRYKRLLVGLSLNNQDGTSIQYAAMISRLAKSERVVFAHVASSLDIPEDLRKEYPELVRPVDEFAKDEMQKLVHDHWDGHPGAQLEFEVDEGSPLIELLRRAKQKEIDLLIMRKRREPLESGSLFEKIARKAPCSVLFIPEGAAPTFKNILVPVDFSENSVDAMDVAVAFASAAGIGEIHCLHVYYVPIGYYKTGKSFEQFAEIMKGHAISHYEDFIKKIDLKGCYVTPFFKLEKDAAKAIEEVTREHEVDLLIMGAKGRRAGAGVLLDSVTEHEIRTTTIPIVAVKKKGEGMGLLEALLKL